MIKTQALACFALLVLVSIPVGADGEVELEEYRSLLSRPEPASRLSAVKALNGMAMISAQRDEALALLRRALFDRDLTVAAQAEFALAALEGGDREAIRAAYGIVAPDRQELVRTTLEAKKPEARFRALVGLGRNYREEELPVIVQAASDAAPEVRGLAIEFLSEMALERLIARQPLEEQLLAVLEKAARDPVAEIRDLAGRFFDQRTAW